jgi:hypothetical protein
MQKGVKRIRAPIAQLELPSPLPPPPLHCPSMPINDYRFLLGECLKDYTFRVPMIEHKINIIKKNLDLVPNMQGSIDYLESELSDTHCRINQINELLEKELL